MVAITGANGLLGSIIARRFLQENVPVVGICRKDSDFQLVADIRQAVAWREADVLDVVALQEALQGVDTVVHTAGIVSFAPRDTKKIFNVNVSGTANVVDACLLNHVSRLLHVSSVAALGIQKGVSRIDEGMKWTDNPLHTAYAESKYLGELEVMRGHEEGLHTGIVNPSVILAPGDLQKSSARLFQYVLQERPFYIDRHINFVDARDVAEMIVKLYRAEKSGERYIANSGCISIQELFTQVANRLNKKAPSIAVRGSVARVVAFLESIRSFVTGCEPLLTKEMLRQGREPGVYENKKSIAELGIEYQSLEKTLDWCCEYYVRYNTINKR
jgi:dihydroflavonol-4-reductase